MSSAYCNKVSITLYRHLNDLIRSRRKAVQISSTRFPHHHDRCSVQDSTGTEAIRYLQHFIETRGVEATHTYSHPRNATLRPVPPKRLTPPYLSAFSAMRPTFRHPLPGARRLRIRRTIWAGKPGAAWRDLEVLTS